MEVGPTCHYVMGGVEVDPDTEAARVPGLFAAGEVAGGMHGSNRLGGNSLSDLLVFGRRAGVAAAEHALEAVRRGRSSPDDALADAARAALAPFDREGGENPYTVQHDLQQTMHDLVGIIRTAPEMEQALERIEALKERVANLSVEGHRQYNPGWHLALDLPHMLSSASASPARRWSGRRAGAGTPATTSPAADAEWGKTNLICSPSPDGAVVRSDSQPLPADAGRARRDLRGARHELRRTFRVWRGDASGGDLQDFTVEVNEGEVVLDVIHRLQATQAGDLAVRWNCKAGKCGSCSAEINGRPRLMCMTRMSTFGEDETVTVTPLRTFPVIRDLVTDVSFNYEQGRADPGVRPAAAGRRRQPPDAAGRRRALAGVPQVHRVLPLPGHLPRHPRPRGATRRRSPDRGS